MVNLQDTLFSSVLEDTSLVRRQGLGPAFQNIFWDSLRIENLAAEMGTDVWLRSNEANIQLEGTVNVSKEATAYRLDGSLTARRGTYKLAFPPVLSREFTVTRGEVQYFGTSDLNAGLDIDARYLVRSRTADDVNVFVHIGGTLYVPRLTLSADVAVGSAPLSDAQIIELLIYGTQRTAATSQQSMQIARTLSPLSSGVFGEVANQVEALAASLGLPIQYFDITPGELSSGFSGTQLTVGYELVPNLFMTVSPRICAIGQPFTGENIGASLEFRFARQWRLAASMDPVGTCGPTGARAANVGRQIGADLFWEKRF